jgi:hypothetical protein
MADKKPVYNPPANDTSSPVATRASNAGSLRSKLGVGTIIGISAAGLAVLVGASVAGSAITLAVSHNDRGHSAVEGMPGDGGRDGGRDGGQLGQGGKQGKSDGSPDGRTPHQHDANGNDIMPDGMMPGDQMPSGQLPGGQLPNGQLPPMPNGTPPAN